MMLQSQVPFQIPGFNSTSIFQNQIRKIEIQEVMLRDIFSFLLVAQKSMNQVDITCSCATADVHVIRKEEQQKV